MMLKISESIKFITQLVESGIKVDSQSKARYDAKCKFDQSEIGGNEVNSSKFEDNKIEKKVQKLF